MGSLISSGRVGRRRPFEALGRAGASMPRIGRSFLFAVAFTCFTGLSLCGVALAQAVRGEIHLEVHDPSGAGMQVSGTLQNLATGVVRPFQTTAEGSLTLSNLPFGRYRLAVSRPGFE